LGLRSARYNNDGSLDTAFGGTGMVITDIGGSQYGSGDAAESVAIQSDGKILAAGYANPLGQNNSDFALVRYNTNGTLDNSFNGTGKVTTDFGSNGDIAYSMAIQSDGKILLAGQTGTYPSTDFALARYNTNGSQDTATFGGGAGKVTTNIGGDDPGRSVAIQSDGKIVTAGYTNVGGSLDFAIARYSTTGVLDTSTFGTNGKVITDFGGGPDTAQSVAIQSDGKIVVAGHGGVTHTSFAVARYNTDAPAVPVPGISTYGLVILAGGLVATTFWIQRRGRKTQNNVRA
jgi:uncharacterized delta-60 repeat protein